MFIVFVYCIIYTMCHVVDLLICCTTLIMVATKLFILFYFFLFCGFIFVLTVSVVVLSSGRLASHALVFS